ncbi:cellulase family glycosylhydrolase [Maribellus mangrovi]|uniref:cellulase family glycosylhydrolase n=1 Tax=Maribellus mangrovi TaxID=3133146 RepID=UPI0030EB812A
MRPIILILFILSQLSLVAQNRDHAFQINDRLGRGINYGNMFEAPTETGWGNPWQPEYAKMIADLGFNHVRILIRWEPEARSSSTTPYTIEATFLNRIKEVVDSALNNGLMAIINMHHHEALFEDPDGQKARFLAQWEQISEFFKDYPDDLLFEILNEPNGNMTATKWNTFLVDALAKIRVKNPTRVVLIGTPEWGGLGGLSKLQLPNDDNIILTIHYYNPFHFTHQGAEWSEGSDAWLGTKWNDTETERQVVQNDFAPLKTMEEQQNIPVHIGEFGAYNKADETSRKKWTTYLARYFESLNWSWAYWEFSAGFGIYNPGSDTYNQFLVDALLHNPMPEPAYYVGTPVYTSDFSQNTSGWNLYTQGGAVAIKENSSGNLHVTISNVGTENWHIQLVKNNVRLEAGKKYRVTFTAKAAGQRQINAYTGQSVSPWSSYSGYNSPTLGTEFLTYSYVFDMNVNDNAARIVFDIGHSAENVSIKSVILEEIKLQEPSSSHIMKDVDSNIFPNPVQNELTVDNRDDFQEIVVSNLQGSVVFSRTLNNFNNLIDMSPLSSGIYFVSLQNQKNRFTTKIIKN